MRRLAAILPAAVLMALGVSTGPAEAVAPVPAAAAVAGPAGAYTPLKPARLLDTRKKIGVTTTTPLGAGRSVDLQVSTRGGVPTSGTSSVVLNVTVVSPSSEGYVTIYPTGSTRPTASSVNFNKGWTGANLVTVKLGSGGKVRVFNYAGNAHVVADVVGYYHATTSTATKSYGGYAAVNPSRILDTRESNAPLPAGYYLSTGADFGTDEQTGLPINPHVRAFAVNVTVVKPTSSGYLTVWNGDENAIPGTSTLNFTTGKTVPNMAVAPTRACGSECTDPTTPVIGVLNGSGGNAHVVVDLVGIYDDNTLDGTWRYRALPSPTRIVNTKTGQGLASAISSNGTRTVTTPSSIRTTDTMALVTNTTANKPTATTVLTLWNPGCTPDPNFQCLRPIASNLNPYAGQLVSNMTITDIGYDYEFLIHNRVGATNLVIDVAGTMEPATAPALAKSAAKVATPRLAPEGVQLAARHR